MKPRTPEQATASYYSRIGSRLGYLLVMNRSQHFGYYDTDHTTETAAQTKYHEEFAKLLNLRPGLNLLDAGCGQGVVASYLAANNRVTVTGVTITPYEVKVAKKRAAKQGVAASTTFILADFAKLPLADNSFDRIYTTETLCHAVDITIVLREFMRILKPGGKLVCMEYEINHAAFSQDMRRDADFVKRHAAIHGMYDFGEGEFVKHLAETGFINVHESDWTPHIKPSFDRLRRLAAPIARLTSSPRLKPYFVNTHAARLYADGVEQGVFAYKAYTANKPS